MSIKAFHLALVAALSAGCTINIAKSGDDTAGGGSPEAEAALNDLLRQQYPNGQAAGDITVDDSIEVASPPDEGPVPVTGGDTTNVSVGYTSPTPIDSVCIGFGSASGAWCIPTSDMAVVTSGTATSGAASVPVMLPLALCDDLASICHNIRCYEFARTSAGTFSRSNITTLAAVCGGCDEPSCQSLLGPACSGGGCTTSSDCAANESCVSGTCVGNGVFRFTLQWSAVSDFDLYVKTPNGITLSYQNRTGDSGELDVDNTSGGSGSIENIYFTAPPTGTYEYWVELYNGSGGSFSISVLKNGASAGMQSGSLTTSGTESSHYTVSYP